MGSSMKEEHHCNYKATVTSFQLMKHDTGIIRRHAPNNLIVLNYKANYGSNQNKQV